MPRSTITQRIHPQPQEMQTVGGSVRLDGMVVLVPEGATRGERAAAELFRRWVADEFLVNLPLSEGSVPRGKKAIVIGTASMVKRRMPRLKMKVDVPAKKEGYALSVTRDGVVAAGRDRNGALYAVATLMQLLELKKGALVCPAVAVRDWPVCRYATSTSTSRGRRTSRSSSVTCGTSCCATSSTASSWRWAAGCGSNGIRKSRPIGSAR